MKQIPSVDLGDFLSDDINKRNDFIENIGKAYEDIGFVALKGHFLDKDLVDELYNQVRDFFSLPDETKSKYEIQGLAGQRGYTSFGKEHAKGRTTGDLKEFFHIYPWGRYPGEVSNHTNQIRSELLKLGSKLLDWLDDYAPQNIRKNFSMKLSDMIKNSGQNLLRVIHYPPVEQKDCDLGSIRAEAHTDINLITILIAEPGLQILNQKSEWLDVELTKNSIVVNIGDMLQECSQGFYKSTVHRVINPDPSKNISRYSMPFFMHPRNEVILSKNLTAEEYLNSRLKEIGLK